MNLFLIILLSNFALGFVYAQPKDYGEKLASSRFDESLLRGDSGGGNGGGNGGETGPHRN